jgi:hypothetical protein
MKQVAVTNGWPQKQNNGWPWPCTSWCREPSGAAARLMQCCTILAAANKNPLKVPECLYAIWVKVNVLGRPEPGGRHVWTVRVIMWLQPGVRVFFSDCCAYIAESGANFRNIVKGPVHGKKCVQNCELKNCNVRVFLSLSFYIFYVLCAFLMTWLFEIFY